eukprot:767600-Hanusia_phi.AAC.7
MLMPQMRRTAFVSLNSVGFPSSCPSDSINCVRLGTCAWMSFCHMFCCPMSCLPRCHFAIPGNNTDTFRANSLRAPKIHGGLKEVKTAKIIWVKGGKCRRKLLIGSTAMAVPSLTETRNRFEQGDKADVRNPVKTMEMVMLRMVKMMKMTMRRWFVTFLMGYLDDFATFSFCDKDGIVNVNVQSQVFSLF